MMMAVPRLYVVELEVRGPKRVFRRGHVRSTKTIVLALPAWSAQDAGYQARLRARRTEPRGTRVTLLDVEPGKAELVMPSLF